MHLGDIEDRALNEDNYEWIGGKLNLDLKDVYDKSPWNIMYCVLTDNAIDDVMHLFYLSKMNKDYQYHLQIPLTNIFPESICKRYDGTLVFGYVHEIEKQIKVSNSISAEILKLIDAYRVSNC